MSNLLQNQSDGVSVDAEQVHIGGDVVGRDKIVSYQGYTVEQVSVLISQISTTFQPRPFDGRCPYLGLAHFDEDSADLFFGRASLIGDLLERMKAARYVFITGPSGSGKSSIARAGLLHALKQGALPGSEKWRYEALRPGRDPIGELARVAASLADTLNAGEDIRTRGLTDPTILHQWAEIALTDKRDRRAVILVDQFEETFTQVTKESERAAFLNLLIHAATVEHGRVLFVFAMRSDFVSNCATYPQLNALLNEQFLQVGSMTPAELVSAIAQPALRVGLKVEPELVAQIIADMKSEPGALPLVQFAMKDLFDAQQAQGGILALTLKDYFARGGIHKALERHADQSLLQLSADEQRIARDVFSGLIQVGRGAEDTRRTAALEELAPTSVARSEVETVVGKLADARLVITNEQAGHDIVTISHEKLIDAWPWLRKLVNENRDVIALQNQIAEDAQEWADQHRDASYLYVGARLANARERLAAQKIAHAPSAGRIVLSGLAQAFVEAGVEAENAQQQREAARMQRELDDARLLAESEKQRAEEQTRSAVKLRRWAVYLIGALGIALVLGVLAGVFGVQSNQNADTASRNAATAEAASTLAVANARTAQAASTQAVTEANIRATAEINANLQRDEAQRQAAIADSRRLAATALNNLDIDLVDPDYPVRILGLRLARAAVDRAHTTEAESALRAALRLSQPTINFGEFAAGSLRDLQFSPDSRRVVVAQAESAQNAWVVEMDSGKLTSHIALSDDLTSLVFTPDSQGVATVEGDGVLRLWDISAFQAHERFKWTGGEAGVNSLVYSPDGQRLLTIDGNSMARVLKAADGQVIAIGPHLNGHVFQAVFSADGNQIMTVAGGDDVQLWDAATGSPVAEVIGQASSVEGTADVGTVIAAHLSPDGKRVLVITSEGVLLQWMAATRQATVLHDVGFTVQTAAFSNDGLRLGMLGTDRALAVYAIDTGQFIGRTKADEVAYRLAFSPDNQRLITFGYNARLWDARNGEELIEVDGGHMFPSGSAAMVEAAFSPDSQVIALYGEGYTYPPMRFEPVYLDGLLDWSRRLVPGELTCEQQAQYQVVDGGCSMPTPTP